MPWPRWLRRSLGSAHAPARDHHDPGVEIEGAKRDRDRLASIDGISPQLETPASEPDKTTVPDTVGA